MVLGRGNLVRFHPEKTPTPLAMVPVNPDPSTPALGLLVKGRQRRILSDRIWWLVRVPLLLAVVATVVGFTGRWWWLSELVGLWRPHLAVLLIPLAGLAMWREAYRHAMAASACAVINLCQVMPVYLPPAAPLVLPASPTDPAAATRLHLVTLKPAPSAQMTLVYADLGRHALNDHAADGLVALNADIVIFDHVAMVDAAHFADRMSEASLNFFPVWNASQGDGVDGSGTVNGLAIIATGASADQRPDLDGALLRWHGLAVIVAHADPGLNAGAAHARRIRLAALADAALAEDDVIVLGTFGCAPWSPPMRDLISQGRLHDARCGFGVLPTWPAACPWLGLPLDHCLVAGALHVSRCRVGDDLGGGHLPLVVELGYQPSQQQSDQRPPAQAAPGPQNK